MPQAHVFSELTKWLILAGYERRLLENVDTRFGRQPLRTNARVDSVELGSQYADKFICSSKNDFSKQQVEGLALVGSMNVLERTATHACVTLRPQIDGCPTSKWT